MALHIFVSLELLYYVVFYSVNSPLVWVAGFKHSHTASAIFSSSPPSLSPHSRLPVRPSSPTASEPSLSMFSLSTPSAASQSPPSSATRLSSSTRTSYVTSPLASYVRGHKCMFDDEHLSNGNIAFLLRGCDSSQRYIYPLELETNKAGLQGAESALIMFNHKDDAIAFARTSVFENSNADRKTNSNSKFNLNVNDNQAGACLYEDISKYHRLLQYAVSTGITKFIREEVQNYVSELYHDIGMNFEALVYAIESLGVYYSNHIKGEQWVGVFEPCLKGLIGHINQMKITGASRIPKDKVTKYPTTWEAPVDPRTLVPLLVDINTNK